MTVKSAEIRVYVHATEDEDKVIQSLEELIPEDIEVEVEVEEYEGHYGNPIKVLRIKLEGEEARRLLDYILSRMGEHDRRFIKTSLDERVDRYGTLHLRFSKQDAYQGRVTLYESDDVIKVEIGFRGNRKKAMAEYERILEEKEDGSQ